MNLRTFLELGRTSNLPTVWTNVVCGAVLSNIAWGTRAAEGALAAPLLARWPAVALAIASGSAFYLGGMFLNDAYDAEWDRAHEKARPIVQGRVSERDVFLIGCLLLGVGFTSSLGTLALGAGWSVIAASLFTVAAVIAYDRWHKQISWAPVLMGACRAGLYALGATAVTSTPSLELWLGAAALWAYVIGLTHVARFETGNTVSRVWVAMLVFSPAALVAAWIWQGGFRNHLGVVALLALQLSWSLRALGIVRSKIDGGIPKAVVSLIAGLCLVDATLISFVSMWAALAALAAFVLTLHWQRSIAGT